MVPSARLASFYFAHFVQTGLFVAYFPLFLAARGLSGLEIAWILAAPHLARVVAPAAFGWLADRSGARRGLVMFGSAAAAAGFASLALVDSLLGMAGVIVAASLLSAGALPLVEAITLGALAGQAGRYGPIRLWGSVGFIAAVMAGGAWLDVRPVSMLPWALAGFALAAFAAAASLPDAPASAQREPGIVAMSPPLQALLAAGFFMSLAHGALYAFLTLHLERSGYSGTAIGALWSVGVVAEIVVFLLLPCLFRLWSLSAIIAASLALAVARFLILGWLADALLLLALAQLLHAATFGAFHAACIAAVHRLVPAGAHARAQAHFSSLAYGAGGAAGLLVAGWAWQAGGAQAAFSVSAIAAAAGLVFARGLKRARL